HGTEDLLNFRLSFAHDHGNAILNDPCFFKSDALPSATEQFLMIHPDVCDHRQYGPDNVRRIEPSAETHFDNGDVHLLCREVLKRHGNSDLEKRWLHVFDENSHTIHKISYSVFLHLRAIDANTFGERLEMGRRVEAGGVACRRQYGRDRGGCTALAVGAGNMN